MDKLLGPEQIREIRGCLNNFDSEGVELYVASINSMIKAFENQEIVQSLYATGKFGEGTKEKLEEFVKIINNFRASYIGNSGLCEQTSKYLEEVEEANNRSM